MNEHVVGRDPRGILYTGMRSVTPVAIIILLGMSQAVPSMPDSPANLAVPLSRFVAAVPCTGILGRPKALSSKELRTAIFVHAKLPVRAWVLHKIKSWPSAASSCGERGGNSLRRRLATIPFKEVSYHDESSRKTFRSDVFEPFRGTDWSWPGDPFAELDRLNAEMNRMFRRFGADGGQQSALAYPAVDLWQDENCLYVEAELPGIQIGDLEIYVTGGNHLSLGGERKPPSVEGGVWHRQERGYGKFSRLVALPCNVKTAEVEADLKDGVLTIKLPKSETAKPRRLAIRAD